MHDSSSPSAGFSDPCFIRGWESLDACPNDPCGRVCIPQLVLLLLGQETVAVHGAATSESGVKNAKIEAKGDGIQNTEGNEDRAHELDSDSGKRSHFQDRSM
jgi:hypothetical protein